MDTVVNDANIKDIKWATVRHESSELVCLSLINIFFCFRTAYIAISVFLTADCSCTTNYFWKTLIEVGSSHLYASFGTFCVQIGQLFEAH